MTSYNITFSPTGGTKKAADILADEIFTNAVNIELCVSEEKLTIPTLTPDDICLISVPSFGGRVPAIAAERISRFKANGAKAVVVCVYGNRAYEDTLTELIDIVQKSQFVCFGAVTALAEHSIVRDIAKGRPDADDAKILKSFAAKIKDKWENKDFTLYSQFPKGKLYKEHSKSKSVPETKETCIGCGLCANECPAKAIDFGNPKTVDTEKCASCMKCTKVCPVGAKALNEAVFGAIADKLGKICTERRENELFV